MTLVFGIDAQHSNVGNFRGKFLADFVVNLHSNFTKEVFIMADIMAQST